MFEYDVFLSYSSKDKSIVHPLAKRLKQDGLRVWFDEWAIRPGDSILLKIEQGLENSHTLLMCMSPAYFVSEWGKLEHQSILFRDPTNKRRRLIPLLIADCNRPDIIAHLAYIDWRKCSDEAYDKIFASCVEREEQRKKEGKAREQEEQYKLALKTDPSDVSTHCSYGNLLANMGRQKEAEEQYKLALEIDPNDAITLHNYGLILASMGRQKEAEEQYQLALKTNPSAAIPKYVHKTLFLDLSVD